MCFGWEVREGKQASGGRAGGALMKGNAVMGDMKGNARRRHHEVLGEAGEYAGERANENNW